MRVLWCLLSILVVTASAAGQVQPKAPSQPKDTAPNVGPHAAIRPEAKEVTLDALQGVTIHTSNSFSARFRSEKGEAPGGFTWRMEIKIGPDDGIHWTGIRNSWWDGPQGRKTRELRRSGTDKIGVSRKEEEYGGLWLLEGGTLKLLRIFGTGAVTLEIALEKTASGLSCSAVAAMAQELGAGPTKDAGVQVSSTQPTSSACRVSKD